jgi:hypothetical protein
VSDDENNVEAGSRAAEACSFEDSLAALEQVLQVSFGRRAIVGRSGKYIRKQIWDRIVVTTPPVVDAELVGADSALTRELKDD